MHVKYNALGRHRSVHPVAAQDGSAESGSPVHSRAIQVAPTEALPTPEDFLAPTTRASGGKKAAGGVRGKGERDVHRFQMRSGDVLVFNASTEAAILHGVESIDEGASEAGDALASAFPVFRTHRYGVQCRIRY